MLKINLLPLERRRVERTPLPFFLGIIGSVLLLLGAAFFSVKKDLELRSLDRTLRQVNLQIQELKRQRVEERYQALHGQITQLQTLHQTIEQVKDSRPFLISQKIDQLVAVFEQSPQIWLLNLKIDDKAPSGVKAQNVVYAFSLDCMSAGADPQNITQFRERFQEPSFQFFQDFQYVNSLEWTQRDFSEMIPDKALQFHLTFVRFKGK